MNKTAGERPHLSIGEVLNLLKEEFPDITISKIRFLESQGLLDPERTPSGYRKFYDGDIERLRWILRQQRENFLPLKVIKGRLERQASTPEEPPAAPERPTERPAERRAGGTTERATGRPATATAPAAAASSPAPAGVARANPLDLGVTGTSFTLDELASASGLSTDDLAELEKYGMLTGRAVAGGVYYDEEAFLVARLAAGFMKFGVEARHLRMYRTSAEREAGFFEQLILPMIKQRNPAARRQAFDTLGELARLGAELRAAMLRQALRDYAES